MDTKEADNSEVWEKAPPGVSVMPLFGKFGNREVAIAMCYQTLMGAFGKALEPRLNHDPIAAVESDHRASVKHLKEIIALF